MDDKLNPIMSTKRTIKCDTLLLSVGLLPENELARGANVDISKVTRGANVDDRLMSNIDGIFECGNVLHVHDLVDFVSMEAKKAGENAVKYINSDKNKKYEKTLIYVSGGVIYVVPELIIKNDDYDNLSLKLRVSNVFKDKYLEVKADDEIIYSRLRPVVAPGEMEKIDLKPDQVLKLRNANTIKVYLRSIEE